MLLVRKMQSYCSQPGRTLLRECHATHQGLYGSAERRVNCVTKLAQREFVA